MKTEEEMLSALNQAMTNAIRSSTIEELRFFQGKIEVLEWYFAKPEEIKDAFEGEPRIPAKEEKIDS